MIDTNNRMDATKALELAELMYVNDPAVINGVTYYYLPTKYHMLYSSERGFGMKKTIRHTRDGELRIGELATLIWKESRGEA